MGIFTMLIIGTGLLLASLRLEAQTTGKGSKAYNKLKKIGGTGAIMAWCGIIITAIIYAI